MLYAMEFRFPYPLFQGIILDSLGYFTPQILTLSYVFLFFLTNSFSKFLKKKVIAVGKVRICY